MLDFIGLPWDPECLDTSIRPNASSSTASKWQVRQKINYRIGRALAQLRKYIARLRHLIDLPRRVQPGSQPLRRGAVFRSQLDGIDAAALR